jgi:hypothetical protein
MLVAAAPPESFHLSPLSRCSSETRPVAREKTPSIGVLTIGAPSLRRWKRRAIAAASAVAIERHPGTSTSSAF